MIRPVEAVHFSLMYLLFGDQPLGYHLMNGVLEVLSAVLFYLVLCRIGIGYGVAILSAMLLLVYPNHDSTHYWMVCGSVTLSLVFSLASILLSLQAITAKRRWLQTLGATFFYGLSMFNYETLMPLAFLNVALVYFVDRHQNAQTRRVVAGSQSIGRTLSMIVAVLIYGRFSATYR